MKYILVPWYRKDRAKQIIIMNLSITTAGQFKVNEKELLRLHIGL